LWGCCFFPDLLNHFSLAEGADRCDIGHRFFFLFDLIYSFLCILSHSANAIHSSEVHFSVCLIL
jgi:hypothetical protein